jgi:hypothetical protein
MLNICGCFWVIRGLESCGPKQHLGNGSLLKREIGDFATPTQDAPFSALKLLLSILQLPFCSGELSGLN